MMAGPITPLTPAASMAGRRRPACDRIADLSWYAVLTFLVAVPATGVWVPVSGHDYSRLIEIVLCLACALAVALQRQAEGATTSAVWALGAVATLAFAATLHAPVLRMAARELTLLLGLAGVAWLVASRPGRDITRLLATVSIAAASYTALVGLGLAVNLSVASDLRPFDLLIGYDNGRFFNHVQTSMLPLLVLATLQPNLSRTVANLAWFGLTGGLALLALSEGRATGLALALGAASAVVLLRVPAGRFVRNLAIGAIAAAVLYLLVFMLLPKWGGLPVQVLHVHGVADSDSAKSRWILWEIAAEGIRRSPWLGIGPMHFSHTWNSDAAHPHNVYLQVAEEWGVPMLLVLLGIAYVGLRTLYRKVHAHRGDAADRRLGLGLFATLIAIGVDGMLSGNFVMPVSQVWIAVVAGAAIGWTRRTTGPPAPVASASRFDMAFGRAIRSLPLVAMLWLAASVAPDLGTHLLDLRGPTVTWPNSGAPRFWSIGWF